MIMSVILVIGGIIGFIYFGKDVPLDMENGVEGNNTGHEDVETNVVLGEGQVDIAGTVAEAKKLGIEYMFIEDESSRVVEQVPQSLEYLDSLD